MDIFWNNTMAKSEVAKGSNRDPVHRKSIPAFLYLKSSIQLPTQGLDMEKTDNFISWILGLRS